MSSSEETFDSLFNYNRPAVVKGAKKVPPRREVPSGASGSPNVRLKISSPAAGSPTGRKKSAKRKPTEQLKTPTTPVSVASHTQKKPREKKEKPPIPSFPMQGMSQPTIVFKSLNPDCEIKSLKNKVSQQMEIIQKLAMEVQELKRTGTGKDKEIRRLKSKNSALKRQLGPKKSDCFRNSSEERVTSKEKRRGRNNYRSRTGQKGDQDRESRSRSNSSEGRSGIVKDLPRARVLQGQELRQVEQQDHGRGMQQHGETVEQEFPNAEPGLGPSPPQLSPGQDHRGLQQVTARLPTSPATSRSNSQLTTTGGGRTIATTLTPAQLQQLAAASGQVFVSSLAQGGQVRLGQQVVRQGVAQIARPSQQERVTPELAGGVEDSYTARKDEQFVRNLQRTETEDSEVQPVLQEKAKEVQPVAAETVDRGVFICDGGKKCKRTFKTENSLMHHKLVWHPKREVTVHRCQTCNKDYENLKSLKRHFAIYHKDIPTADTTCQECEEELPTKAHLVKHMKRFHIEAKCSNCGKFFANGKKLRSHRSTCLKKKSKKSVFKSPDKKLGSQNSPDDDE